MDDRLRFIFARRSVRRYQEKAVSDVDVRALLEAAMAAPSANNSRPWHFVAATDRRSLKALAARHPYGKMLTGAGLCIAVCADASLSAWWQHDCSAAVENILIAAAALGLGGVWLGVHGRADRVKAVREILGIPQQISVLCLVSIGHPAEAPEPRTQYDPARVHRGRW
jgi:nitroreductase